MYNQCVCFWHFWKGLFFRIGNGSFFVMYTDGSRTDFFSKHSPARIPTKVLLNQESHPGNIPKTLFFARFSREKRGFNISRVHGKNSQALFLFLAELQKKKKGYRGGIASLLFLLPCSLSELRWSALPLLSRKLIVMFLLFPPASDIADLQENMLHLCKKKSHNTRFHL